MMTTLRSIRLAVAVLATMTGLHWITPDRSGAGRIAEVIAAKGWITARADPTLPKPDGWRLVIQAGGRELFNHRIGSGDASVGPVALSRDGVGVAFIKGEPDPPVAGEPAMITRSILSVMELDGSARRELVEVGDSLPALAWSHDRRKLAVAGDVAGAPPGLVVLDLTKPRVTVVFSRLESQHGPSVDMTTQAWSPDGRLVYTNGDREMVILDREGHVVEKLGRGWSPTWSPDGRWIAYREVGAKRGFGDYFILDLERHERRRVLSAPKTKLEEFLAEGSYLGDMNSWGGEP